MDKGEMNERSTLIDCPNCGKQMTLFCVEEQRRCPECDYDLTEWLAELRGEERSVEELLQVM